MFDPAAQDLTEDDRSKLKQLIAGLGDRVDTDPSLRVMLKAYASGTNRTASQARRVSLTRALAVRTYLIDEGLPGVRIDVRALGGQDRGKPGRSG